MLDTSLQSAGLEDSGRGGAGGEAASAPERPALTREQKG